MGPSAPPDHGHFRSERADRRDFDSKAFAGASHDRTKVDVPHD